MAQIEFTPSEIVLLREILQRYLAEVISEIAHSDRKDFREFLTRRREFMEESIRRLDREREREGKGKRELIGLERIRKVEILQGLTDWELENISWFFQEEKTPAGVILCEEGARADQLYILEQGSVRIDSKRLGPLEVNTPGKIVGWSFLVPPYRYTASAQTTSRSIFLVIKSPDFYYLIHKEPKMGVKVMDNLAQIIATRFKGPEDSPRQ